MTLLKAFHGFTIYTVLWQNIFFCSCCFGISGWDPREDATCHLVLGDFSAHIINRRETRWWWLGGNQDLSKTFHKLAKGWWWNCSCTVGSAVTYLGHLGEEGSRAANCLPPGGELSQMTGDGRPGKLRKDTFWFLASSWNSWISREVSADQNVVVEAKILEWEEFVEANENNLQLASKRFWQTERLLREGWHGLAQMVLSRVGEPLTSTREIVRQW